MPAAKELCCPIVGEVTPNLSKPPDTKPGVAGHLIFYDPLADTAHLELRHRRGANSSQGSSPV